MPTPELRASWATSLRYLVASRFYLPANLSDADADAAWVPVLEYLQRNELGLALDEAMDLGKESSAPPEYWHELLLAADNMGLAEQSAEIRARL
jgi:hypothetical protein